VSVATCMVSVDVPPGLTVVGLRVGVSPWSAVAVRSTDDENPLSPVMDIDDTLEEPAWTVRDPGVADILKSGPRIVTVIIV
jgi:hypothetical protein